jgi:XTP/dITP diphosphohydrolase
MLQILIATNNPGKLREIQALLAGIPAELVLPRQLGIEMDVAETGETYAENAALKAVSFARASGLLTLADDSGLEVDALDGRPGLHSARFSPEPGATDADRRRLLRERLAGSPRPWKARFRCVVAIAEPATEPDMPHITSTPHLISVDLSYSEGVCEGEIIPDERGSDGFGYDPVFLLPELGRTMAELTMEEKNHLSHRARAILAARPRLLELLGAQRN